MNKYLVRVIKYEIHEVDAENDDDAIDILLESNESDTRIDEFYHTDSFNDADMWINVENNNIEDAKAQLKEGLETY